LKLGIIWGVVANLLIFVKPVVLLGFSICTGPSSFLPQNLSQMGH